ncbi:hypothetical protein L195_g011470 [Trifolium pratense]|uniref:Uncharacterized protein n=1 Tax=Trifolium pratense TaxID=57577 RepID=A0A2K3PHM0_TRIPR|nr:hypothetical protein L195_g011470 [Trifolium pratense]
MVMVEVCFWYGGSQWGSWQQLSFGMMIVVDMDLTVPLACEERITYRGWTGTIVSITLDLYEKPP